MNQLEPKWHALYVSSRQEKTAGQILSKRGVEVFVPLVKIVRQWSDRKKMVEMPLLPGYLFVHTLPSENDKILQTRGIVAFVKIEGRIAVVRDNEIEVLKQLVGLGCKMEIAQTMRSFEEGEKVLITAGILKGMEGYVVEKKEGKYIDIVLESIGQSIRVKLPEENLLPA
jgi:transcriptional antiterminator RfaH